LVGWSDAAYAAAGARKKVLRIAMTAVAALRMSPPSRFTIRNLIAIVAKTVRVAPEMCQGHSSTSARIEARLGALR
jgi:hypothetical protein